MSAMQELQAESRLTVSSGEEPLAASLGAFAHVQADAAKIESLRRDPGPLTGREVPASFLKHSDEQSVCGFAAVLEAIRDGGQPIESYRDWGVVGAPQYPGRVLGGAAMAKFFDQGVRGISPHSIPQAALHSLSGVISVGLGMGGPNLGAGGGATALAEGLTTAFSALATRRLPGLWLVVSAWDREPLPQKNGRAVVEGVCHAVAMALSPVEDAAERLCLVLSHDRARSAGKKHDALREAPATVMSLADALARQRRAPWGAVLWRLEMDWGAEVVLAKKHSSH